MAAKRVQAIQRKKLAQQKVSQLKEDRAAMPKEVTINLEALSDDPVVKPSDAPAVKLLLDPPSPAAPAVAAPSVRRTTPLSAAQDAGATTVALEVSAVLVAPSPPPRTNHGQRERDDAAMRLQAIQRSRSAQKRVGALKENKLKEMLQRAAPQPQPSMFANLVTSIYNFSWDSFSHEEPEERDDPFRYV